MAFSPSSNFGKLTKKNVDIIEQVFYNLGIATLVCVVNTRRGERITVNESNDFYREEINKMLASIDRNDVLEYVYMIVSDIMGEEK